MRFLSFQIVALAIGLTMVVESQAQTGGHDYGDCVLGGEFSTCGTHLSKLRASRGINYLAEVSCPSCVNGEPIISQDGSILYPQVCPPDKHWSDPNDDNINTVNPHYRDADNGLTGAIVSGFKKRECWQGGNCIAGPCSHVPTGEDDPETGFPVTELRCARSGAKISYIIKELSGICMDPAQMGGYGGSGPPQ